MGKLTTEEFENFFKQKEKVDMIAELAEQIDVKPNEYIFRELVNKISFEEEDYEDFIYYLITKHNVHGELNQMLGHIEDHIDYENGRSEAVADYVRRVSRSVW